MNTVAQSTAGEHYFIYLEWSFVNGDGPISQEYRLQLIQIYRSAENSIGDSSQSEETDCLTDLGLQGGGKTDVD